MKAFTPLCYRLDVELDKKPDDVKWFVNKMLIKPSQRYQIRTEENRAELLINDLTPADNGVYTVQVTVGDERVVSSCQLFVEGLEKPEIETVLPSFVEELQDVEVEDGTEFTLQVDIAICFCYSLLMAINHQDVIAQLIDQYSNNFFLKKCIFSKFYSIEKIFLDGYCME